MWRKGNPFALLVGMQTGAATVESSREFPQKIKNRTAFWPSLPSSSNISKEAPNTNLKEYVHPYVLCSIIYNNQDLKAAQVPISRGVDEKAVVVLHTRKYHMAIKKKKILHFVMAWMEMETIMLSEIGQSGKTNTIWFHSYVKSNEQTELKSIKRQTHR